MKSSIETPPLTALESFLDEILDGAIAFEIQIDNARLHCPNTSCSDYGRHRHSSLRPISSQYENHRIVHKAERWETQITNNDFMATAPRRRQVHCEPEKIRAFQPGGRPTPLALKPQTRESKIPSNRDLTSELLGEALSLIVDARRDHALTSSSF